MKRRQIRAAALLWLLAAACLPRVALSRQGAPGAAGKGQPADEPAATGAAKPAIKGRLDVEMLDLNPYLPPEGAPAKSGDGKAAPAAGGAQPRCAAAAEPPRLRVSPGGSSARSAASESGWQSLLRSL